MIGDAVLIMIYTSGKFFRGYNSSKEAYDELYPAIIEFRSIALI